jgi:ribonuclease HI
MNGFALFTDVCVNPQRKLGVGGYLFVPLQFLEKDPHDIEREEVFARLKIKRFAETSSSKLEVQTVLWALDELREVLSGSAPGSLRMYTDSQCVAGLMGRRAGLINRDFAVRRSGRELAHAPLYRAFYAAYDQFGFQLVKVPGHSRADTHDSVQRIFSYVDREVRKTFKFWMNENQDDPAGSTDIISEFL